MTEERTIIRYDFEGGGYVCINATNGVMTDEALDMVEVLMNLKREELRRRKDHIAPVKTVVPVKPVAPVKAAPEIEALDVRVTPNQVPIEVQSGVTPVRLPGETDGEYWGRITKVP